MVNCTVLPNGDLLVTAGNEARQSIGNMARGHQGWWGILADIFEPHFTNGRYEPFDAGDGNPFVGFTSAPCIAESMTLEDDGSRTIDGRYWWFPDYMIRDPLEELRTKGRVVFTLAA